MLHHSTPRQGKPLRKAHDHQESRGQNGPAGNGGGGQATNQEGRYAHCQQGRNQSAFASKFVTKVSKDDRAQRARDERDPKHSEGAQELGGLVQAGEEQSREDEDRRCGVDVEVVELDRRANKAGNNHPSP